MAVHQHPVTYTAWSNKGGVFAIVTSLWRGLVTRQQVLVSTVNTSSVNDHKENKVILNGRLRSFAAFVPTSNSEEQLIKGRLSSFLSLGGATLYYTFSARNCWQTAWKTSWLRQVTKAVSRYTGWVDQWRIQDEQKWRECKHGGAQLTTLSDYSNVNHLVLTSLTLQLWLKSSLVIVHPRERERCV